MGHSVKPILISKDGRWVVPREYALHFPEEANLDPESYLKRFEEINGVNAGPFSGLDCDLVFLGLHGTTGEDGSVQGFLKVLGIPFTGSDVKASAIAMDKVRANRLFQIAGMAVAPFWELKKKDFLSDPTLVEKLSTLR